MIGDFNNTAKLLLENSLVTPESDSCVLCWKASKVKFNTMVHPSSQDRLEITMETTTTRKAMLLYNHKVK